MIFHCSLLIAVELIIFLMVMNLWTFLAYNFYSLVVSSFNYIVSLYFSGTPFTCTDLNFTWHCDSISWNFSYLRNSEVAGDYASLVSSHLPNIPPNFRKVMLLHETISGFLGPSSFDRSFIPKNNFFFTNAKVRCPLKTIFSVPLATDHDVKEPNNC